jgi:hypothetical protein
MSNSKIQVSELDFNQIRENLKTFLSGQSTFSDYKFDGSAISTLVDLLAYNTHYNALYTNLAVNEMFLDSASKRQSLVSLANNFGYLPRSATCAKGIVNVKVGPPTNATPQSLTLPALSPFLASIDSKQYAFFTIDDYTTNIEYTSLALPYYEFKNVNLYEGIPRSLTYVCTSEEEKFTIPFSDIDLSTLKITIQETGEIVDSVTYTRSDFITELTPYSEIYHIKELENGTYQLYFGSNNLGKPISTGNIISLTCLSTSKAEGNGAIGFTFGGENLPGNVTVQTIANSSGGKEKETTEEIRSNVSQFFFDQNRAVTPGDFSAIIKRYWEDIDSISVWGGENNDPIMYGKVFISIKPSSKLYLTASEESYIREVILRPRCTTSLTMEFVKPSYIELEVNTTAHYNKNATARSADSIKASIQNAITNYNENTLKKFDGVFRMSKFSTMIDNVDTSIQSSITRIKLFISVEPKFDITAEYKCNIINPIYSSGEPEESFISTGFYIDYTSNVYYLDDDGRGNIRLFRRIEGTNSKVIVNSSLGKSTINYKKGIIKISGLKILRLDEPNFKFIIKPQSFDVVSVRNQIVIIPNSRVTVSLVEDTISSGMSTGGTNYTFTSSRN